MVVDDQGGFLSQRSHPILARVVTRIEADRLILEGPELSPLEVPLDPGRGGRRSVTVWKDTCDAVTEGPEAAEWFTTLLGTRCELVRQTDDGIRRVDQIFAEPDDRVSFADGFPFLLINLASVADLNDRLESPVPSDRFRANLVIDGCEAYAEDGWSDLEIGGILFRVAKPCARCVVITTDQHDGTRSSEPLRTLATYRRIGDKVLFGQNLIHTGYGTVRVGDEVRVPPAR
jgi:uncharacterized protein YcbX